MTCDLGLLTWDLELLSFDLWFVTFDSGLVTHDLCLDLGLVTLVCDLWLVTHDSGLVCFCLWLNKFISCRKCGAVINMSSSAAEFPTPQMTVYSATKVNSVKEMQMSCLFVCLFVCCCVVETVLVIFNLSPIPYCSNYKWQSDGLLSFLGFCGSFFPCTCSWVFKGWHHNPGFTFCFEHHLAAHKLALSLNMTLFNTVNLNLNTCAMLCNTFSQQWVSHYGFSVSKTWPTPA